MVLRLPLPVKNRSFSHPKAMSMSQSAAPVVVRQEGQGGTAIRALEAEGPGRPYSQLPVLSVVKRLECHSSLKREDLFIAAIAIARTEQQLTDVKSLLK